MIFFSLCIPWFWFDTDPSSQCLSFTSICINNFFCLCFRKRWLHALVCVVLWNTFIKRNSLTAINGAGVRAHFTPYESLLINYSVFINDFGCLRVLCVSHTHTTHHCGMLKSIKKIHIHSRMYVQPNWKSSHSVKKVWKFLSKVCSTSKYSPACVYVMNGKAKRSAI